MKKFLNSFKYALKGIYFAFKSEFNMKIHLIMAIIAIICGIIFNISLLEWISIFVVIALVIGAEIFNTAIEKLVDLVSPNQNALAGKVKDLSAGSVLIFAILSVIVGLIIFLPKIFG